MHDEHRRAWAVPKGELRDRAAADLRAGTPLWLRDVSLPAALPRFVLLDARQNIASPEECIRHYGDILRNPGGYVLVLEGDDDATYEIVDWPLDFRKSVKRLVYCVTLLRVPAR